MREECVVCAAGSISVRTPTENLCVAIVARMPGSARRRER